MFNFLSGNNSLKMGLDAATAVTMTIIIELYKKIVFFNVSKLKIKY